MKNEEIFSAKAFFSLLTILFSLFFVSLRHEIIKNYPHEKEFCYFGPYCSRHVFNHVMTEQEPGTGSGSGRTSE